MNESKPAPTHPLLEWSPGSWRDRSALQQPAWPDLQALAAAQEELALLPPLVTSWEIEALKENLWLAGRGDAFVLQAGDCAESFADCRPGRITDMLKVLLQVSLILVHGGGRPVVRIGRIAGQYAKPRSQDLETRGEETHPAYRGDNVNCPNFDAASRTPDPTLLLRGHERAALTLNFVRALAGGGFADLHHAETWDLAFVGDSELAGEYHKIVHEVQEGLRFMEIVAGRSIREFAQVDIWTSHECLVLPLEQALTRRVPRRDGWYNLSTHLPWLGIRTAAQEGAHAEYARGICNPIGIKVGTSTNPAALRRLVEFLNPGSERGRVVLIHRFGAEGIEQGLPPVIAAMEGLQAAPVWLCDPMHGNTRSVSIPGRGAGESVKTRHFDDVVAESEAAMAIHARIGVPLGGVHLELTGEDVTECTGGARQLSPKDLARAYRTHVDPRLNAEQALELAMRLSRRMRAARGV
ncbi:MAG: 3-deoxy-7-phosphoheptulonate synthase class II [Planctomycetota bacterium]|nr:3-deoxy-7-phosphoheptulonate synthase class II [Planctomycetota bacterium]MDA1106400.1 3-deoxy-7-phosphoheptulonate synthase class II [Planctomycetota bacterium]